MTAKESDDSAQKTSHSMMPHMPSGHHVPHAPHVHVPHPHVPHPQETRIQVFLLGDSKVVMPIVTAIAESRKNSDKARHMKLLHSKDDGKSEKSKHDEPIDPTKPFQDKFVDSKDNGHNVRYALTISSWTTPINTEEQKKSFVDATKHHGGTTFVTVAENKQALDKAKNTLRTVQELIKDSSLSVAMDKHEFERLAGPEKTSYKNQFHQEFSAQFATFSHQTPLEVLNVAVMSYLIKNPKHNSLFHHDGNKKEHRFPFLEHLHIKHHKHHKNTEHGQDHGKDHKQSEHGQEHGKEHKQAEHGQEHGKDREHGQEHGKEHKPSEHKSDEHKTQSGEHKTQSGEHKTQSGEHKTQSGEHKVQSGEHKTPSGEHKTPSGEHKTQSGDHKTEGGDHKTQTGEHKTQSSEHKTQGDDHKSQSQGKSEQGKEHHSQSQTQGTDHTSAPTKPQ